MRWLSRWWCVNSEEKVALWLKDAKVRWLGYGDQTPGRSAVLALLLELEMEIL